MLYAPWTRRWRTRWTWTGVQPMVSIRPVGQVLGVDAYATDRGPWKAPACDEAQSLDAVGVEYEDDRCGPHHTGPGPAVVTGLPPILGLGDRGGDVSRTPVHGDTLLFVTFSRSFLFVESSSRT